MIGNHQNVLGIIPARYNSSRLTGKPLLLIENKPMIQHVFEKTKKILNHVVVATDDKRIFDCVNQFGGNVVMTKSEHQTGTDRCLEAFLIWTKNNVINPSVILNIQGDEPMLCEEHLLKVIDCFEDSSTTMASLALQLTKKDQLHPGMVYLTRDQSENALYFSRNPIPFLPEHEFKNWTQHHNYLQHIGLYGFTPKALERFCALKKSQLEIKENLEQLRWLENGQKIRIATTNQKTHPVDTLDDLTKVRALFSSKGE